jgi:hypothetical protein
MMQAKYTVCLKELMENPVIMPMLEKALVFRQTSLSYTIVFQSLASLCTLKTAYKY